MPSLISPSSHLPGKLRPLFWSYDFKKLSSAKSPNLILNQVLNYGDLKDLNWLKEKFGLSAIRHFLSRAPEGSFPQATLRFIAIFFHVSLPRPRPRGARAKKA
jgi:hypothetical protein